MSTKNELQEFYQKRKETLPVYSTERVRGTPAHAPLWKSTVILHDNRRFVGEPSAKKSTAELNAATVALEYTPLDLEHAALANVSSLECEDIAMLCIDRSTICLIDIENVPQAVSIDLSTIPKRVFVLGLVGHCHAMAQKPFPFGKYIVRSSISDAADHALTFMAGYIASHIVSEDLGLGDTVRPKMIILSRDHYAEATVWCIKQQGFRAHHVTSVEELVRHF